MIVHNLRGNARQSGDAPCSGRRHTVFDRRWKGVTGFLFGRCSCADAYFLAILNTSCRGSVVNMYDAISDHLPMLLALEDAIHVLQASLDGSYRIFDWTALF